MDLVTYITLIVAVSGVVLSIISILYTQHQNKRYLDVDIELDTSKTRMSSDPCDTEISLLAFNPSFRSVPITKCEFYANNKLINLGARGVFPHPLKERTFVKVRATNKHPFPHVLKEGEVTFVTIHAGSLANLLKSKNFKGNVELTGCYETIGKKYWSKSSLKFNTDYWEICYRY